MPRLTVCLFYVFTLTAATIYFCSLTHLLDEREGEGRWHDMAPEDLSSLSLSLSSSSVGQVSTGCIVLYRAVLCTVLVFSPPLSSSQPVLPDVKSRLRPTPSAAKSPQESDTPSASLQEHIATLHGDELSLLEEEKGGSAVAVPLREAFQRKAEKRKSAAKQREFHNNISAMRVSHEDEKRRFHYREKQQHRKLQKWLNRKLWNVDRLETKVR